jgi:hypothetical protein
MAAADFDHWDRLRAGEIAARVEVLAQRVASDVASGPVGAAERIKKNEDELEEASKRMRVASRHNFEAFTAVTDSGAQKSTHANAPPPYTSKLHGLQRLTLLPIDASAFEGLSNEDARWVSQQEGRFSSVSEGLATKPNFALISFRGRELHEWPARQSRNRQPALRRISDRPRQRMGGPSGEHSR